MLERIGFDSEAAGAASAAEEAAEAVEITDILIALSVKVLILLRRTNKASGTPVQFYFEN
jgi:hypothetical protein